MSTAGAVTAEPVPNATVLVQAGEERQDLPGVRGPHRDGAPHGRRVVEARVRIANMAASSE